MNERDTNPAKDHPAKDQRSAQGGSKDTDDLSSVKDVQKTGMQEHARQVDQTPDDVTGANDGMQPSIRNH
ncbi:hypothetical protein [Deinococcus knuensis]|uniref:Uncharacterized protein n=1 Tax=Deinococcus knuensis TaxID=1837380 RepID=A0ABQ2SDS3_9DEIO|nr:hypothetical protein [Deinococcus knuensis]GGS21084.1 hypothetical protein GCM10008961_10930 [Deinococcus knuensis]